MEVFMAIVIGVLFASGVYMLLRPNLIRIVLGLGLLSNGANLLLITCGGYARVREAPFMTDGADPASLMDPLPPDIILTAIVISFAVGALFLTLCYRVYLDHGTDNPEKLPNHNGEDEATALAEATDDVAENSDAASDDARHGAVPDVVAELSEPREDAPHENVPSGAQWAG